MKVLVLLGVLLCFVEWSTSIPSDFVFPPLKNGGKNWALLVAGSNGWGNYRHQADVCHAYQILKNHGIPDEQIVVMMVDDIADNKMNPTPGKIINRPDGDDVYHGVPKDYTGLKEVLPDIFLKVLQGKKEELLGIGSGKVIDSGPNDNVFVNFVDHGGPGIVAFGRVFLHAMDLIETLDNMHKDKKFAELLFYMEACESGSMFQYLLAKNRNILAVTASNATTSSYACYFDKKRKTYLGDVFSVKWMEDSDKENLNEETIEKQFKIVKKETNTSTVCQFGDMKMDSLKVSEFQGSAQSNQIFVPIPDPNVGAVPSEDVDLHINMNLFKLSTTAEERKYYSEKIAQESMRRGKVAPLVKLIVSIAKNHDNTEVDRILNSRMGLARPECYKAVVEHLADTCSQLELRQQFGYAFKHLYAFVNLCAESVPTETIKEAISKGCRFCNCAFKRWLSNTNFGNPANWNAGRPPCGNDVAVIHEESAAVFLQVNSTVKELVMPINGEVVFGANVVLGFTEQPDHSATCTPYSSDVEFNVTYPRDWFDASNWCETDSETGDCKVIPRLDSEKVPCMNDDVVYPSGNSFYVNLETGLDVKINTLKITGKAYTTATFQSFLSTDQGKGMFPLPANNGQRSTVTILRRPCTDPTGCQCGNNQKELLSRICAIQQKRCTKAQCRTPLKPIGHCCDICGGVVVMKYGSGFRFDTLLNGIRRNVIDGRAEYKDIQVITSKIDEGVVQVALVDTDGVRASQLARAINKELQNDINAGGFRYSVLSVITETSVGGSSSGPTAGAQKSEPLPKGEIAGFVVGGAVLLVVVLLAAIFVYRRKKSTTDDLGFKVFDKITFKKPNFRKPRVEVPPSFGFRFGGPENVGPSQGFDNPMYGNNPLENEKPMDIEMMPSSLGLEQEEQPALDSSRGFDNPLYDNAPLNESMFTDPSVVEKDSSNLEARPTSFVNPIAMMDEKPDT
ncbi:uncharacterized protein LOC125649614 [Ostrea edulis]|uniref:uncharacterized protein LOC125649614 n=1 Tax=Ostrea edulis TaxID=37623 RepID=UPI0024AFC4AC|nr:uncharacterized protein LOC125649614 [Ostrea edulis]